MITRLLSMRLVVHVGLVLLMFLAGCSSGAPAAAPEPTATLPVLPTWEYQQPTPLPSGFEQVITPTPEIGESQSALDPVAVERGLGRYEALECATCHGGSGEGVEGKGSALVGITLSEADFISFLRSGGTVGVSHQYSTNRLSESGGKNLYQYILSLGTE